MAEATIWGIHAGRTGDADSLFLRRNFVGIGWDPMGDLAAIPPNRDAYKAAVSRAYPDHKAGAIPNIAGQLFRFVREMEDLRVYLAGPEDVPQAGRVGDHRFGRLEQL